MTSNYFTALMRASGLRPASPPDAGGRVPASEAIVEEHEMRTVSPAADSAQGQPLQQSQPQPTPGLPDALPLAGSAISRTDPELPGAAESFLPPQAKPDESPTEATSAVAAVPAVPPDPESRLAVLPNAGPDSGAPDNEITPKADERAEVQQNALMRVAMHWVNSGARPDPLASATLLPPAVDPLQAEPDLESVASPEPVTPVVSVEKPALAPRDLMRASSSRALRNSALIEAVPWPDEPAPREDMATDTVEISIGAIHLRVDAPPVKLAPPPVQPAPTRANPPKRGDFQRRLLRRL